MNPPLCCCEVGFYRYTSRPRLGEWVHFRLLHSRIARRSPRPPGEGRLPRDTPCKIIDSYQPISQRVDLPMDDLIYGLSTSPPPPSKEHFMRNDLSPSVCVYVCLRLSSLCDDVACLAV